MQAYEHSIFLGDARPTAIPGASASVGGQAQQGFSNEAGVYLVPITPGALSGSIAAAGYTGADLSGTAGAGQTRMDDALLATSGPPVAVAAAGAVATSALVVGHVTDSQTGAGIGGALVTIVVNGQTLIGLTDANGDFRFAVEPGAVSGTIVATGYGSTSFTVTVAAGDTVNVNVASNPPVLPPTGLPGLMNEVEILVPPPGTVTDWERVTVVGTVLLPSSQVAVNGIPATVVGNRFTAKHVDLAMGANTITATATNVGSPAAGKTIAVERSTAPVLAVTIYSPPEGATVPGSGLVVRGFVSAKNSVTNAAGNFVAVDEGVFDLLDQPVATDDTHVSVLSTICGITEEASDRETSLRALRSGRSVARNGRRGSVEPSHRPLAPQSGDRAVRRRGERVGRDENRELPSHLDAGAGWGVVDRRLLRFAIGTLLGLGVVWAAWQWLTGANVAPALSGRVVDAETGLPVEGVHVFVSYGLMVNRLGRFVSMGGSTTKHLGYQATRTAKDGSFSFGEQRLGPFQRAFWRYRSPYIHWVHEGYGWGDVFGWGVERGTQIEIARDLEKAHLLHGGNPKAIRDACDSTTRPDKCAAAIRGD